MELIKMLIGLSIPMIVAGVLHMVVVKFNWLSSFARPISIRLFGKNKTWRGFIVMPILGILGVFLAKELAPEIFEGISLTLLGATQGFFYALFELPNSWWKRKKKIEPGKLPSSGKILHAVVDQADSVLGCSIIYFAFLDKFNVSMFLAMIIFGTCIHLLFNYLLFLAKIRKEPL